MPEYTGNPTGSGNPPGEYSKSYLTAQEGGEGHFVSKKSYRGDMNVGGIVESAPVVGNQPTQEGDSGLFTNRENSI